MLNRYICSACVMGTEKDSNDAIYTYICGALTLSLGLTLLMPVGVMKIARGPAIS